MIDTVQTGGRGGDEVDRNCLARVAAFPSAVFRFNLLSAGPTAGRDAASGAGGTPALRAW